ncbi:unnamed protein product [Closterium sp. Naga37s-1]|nr:unnamed protein product [Closterium sp. Naga37s-1]
MLLSHRTAERSDAMRGGASSLHIAADCRREQERAPGSSREQPHPRPPPCLAAVPFAPFRADSFRAPPPRLLPPTMRAMGDEGCDDARASLLSHESEPECAQVAGMASDLVVTIGQRAFHVHQYPLFSLSTVIASAAAAAGEGTGPMQADLSFLPGGALSFVPIACYCYGRPCRLSPHSVLLVRSAGTDAPPKQEGESVGVGVWGVREWGVREWGVRESGSVGVCVWGVREWGVRESGSVGVCVWGVREWGVRENGSVEVREWGVRESGSVGVRDRSIAAGDERVWVQPRTATAAAGNAAPAAPPAALPALPARALIAEAGNGHTAAEQHTGAPLLPVSAGLAAAGAAAAAAGGEAEAAVGHGLWGCLLAHSYARLARSFPASPAASRSSPLRPRHPASLHPPSLPPALTRLPLHHATLLPALPLPSCHTPPHSGGWDGAASVPNPPCPCERMLPLSHAVPRHALRRSSRLFLYQPVPQP